jgi:hypothetical protein
MVASYPSPNSSFSGQYEKTIRGRHPCAQVICHNTSSVGYGVIIHKDRPCIQRLIVKVRYNTCFKDALPTYLSIEVGLYCNEVNFTVIWCPSSDHDWVSSERKQSIFEASVVPHFDNQPLNTRPVFMDDNAISHRACVVTDYLRDESITTIPDLSIEVGFYCNEVKLTVIWCTSSDHDWASSERKSFYNVTLAIGSVRLSPYAWSTTCRDHTDPVLPPEETMP